MELATLQGCSDWLRHWRSVLGFYLVDSMGFYLVDSMSDPKFPLSDELTARFLRLELLWKALDATLRVQMDHELWQDFTLDCPLDMSESWEIRTEDGNRFHVQVRKVAKRDSSREG